MTTLLDVVADLEKLANDLKAIHGTIWGKELQTFTPIGEEKTSQDQQIRQQLNLPQHWKKSGHFPHRNLVQD